MIRKKLMTTIRKTEKKNDDPYDTEEKHEGRTYNEKNAVIMTKIIRLLLMLLLLMMIMMMMLPDVHN